MSSRVLSFEVSHALVYGTERAAILYHFRHWIEINHAGKRNFHDGKTWSYQTLEALLKHFPFFNRSALHRHLTWLTSEEGPMIKGNYNTNRHDRTVWYAFKNESNWIREDYRNSIDISQKREMEFSKMGNGFPGNGTPLPDNKPDTLPTSSKEEEFLQKKEPSEKVKNLAEELWKEIHEVNPKAIQPDLEKWSREMHQMIRLDKRTEEEVRSIIFYVFHVSDFWYKTILCPKNLRKNFARLWVAANDKKKEEKWKTKYQTGSTSYKQNSSGYVSPELVFPSPEQRLKILNG